jgi:cellulose synthase operon protein C
VLYAAADTVTGGNLMVRVESAGTLEVLVDGAVVLRKDDRVRLTPRITWRELHLRNGSHRVVVKFLASAAPFRLAIIPETPAIPAQTGAAEIDYAPEAAYIAAAQKYWAGDYGGVIANLNGVKVSGSALSDFLLYRAWARVAEESPEAPAMLNATLQAAPAAMAAEYELAARAFAADRTDEALMRLQRVVNTRESFFPGQQLLAQIAIRLNWTTLTERALSAQMRVRPSCAVLLEGYKFFAGHARYERARELRRRLADCAPDTLAYERTLGEAGEHASAAFAAEATVARRPLDRNARELLVRELALAGQAEKARAAAAELAALAPNSSRYRRLAERAASNPSALLDDGGLRNTEFARQEPFYAKYRRSGIEMVRTTNDRKFSGGPAVMLLNDRVSRLWDGGEVSVYVHKLTRVLDRDGIEKYGEVEIPRGAEVLELRTIKADGGVVEPESTPQKATVSMPALAAGGAIEEEYVLHYGDGGGIAEHAKEFRHTFGSFAAPILYSRFVAIAPASDNSLRAEVAPGIVPARLETVGNASIRTWEKNDIPQSVEEAAIAQGDVLPVVALEQEILGGWNNIRDRFRNQLVDALRMGPRVEHEAAEARAAESPAKAHEIFRRIVDSVRPSGGFNPEDMISAEETLAGRSGSRTIAVLAVARAAGLDADLVLARNAGNLVRDGRASLALYSRPLLRFRFPDGREVFADAETDGLPFGALPPSLERRDALLVPVLRDNVEKAAAGPLVSLPTTVDEQSVADADVTLESDGSLRADVTIRMGAWRGAQMRTILGGIEPQQRARFYQQLAQRIFAGADEVTGATRNEHDPDRPLELTLHCRAPRYVSLGHSTTEIDQLVPTLGLKKMYSGSNRRFPLYIDTPLVESARFRVHLPANVSVAGGMPELNLSGAFGSYSLSLRRLSPDVLDIQRSFRIPAQVVAPERFADFSLFAARIDEAERQKIILQRN